MEFRDEWRKMNGVVAFPGRHGASAWEGRRARRIRGWMKRWLDNARRFLADAAGAVTVEYSLLLATFGIPMILVFRLLLGTLAEYYKTVTFLETLPLP